jgi:hypothetical protein
MSTYPQYTLKSPDVYPLTITPLDTLPLRMPGAIRSRDLMQVGRYRCRPALGPSSL